MHEYSYGQVSGFAIRELHAIGSRAERIEKFDHTNGESHLFEIDPDHTHTELPTPGLFASVWRSRTGGVYVAHRDGALFTRTPRGTYDRCDVRGSLLGLWGLDDEHIYAWGLAGEDPVMFTKDPRSSAWTPMPSPPELVFNLSGDRPDRLMAVGTRGTISLWDGKVWVPQSSPVTGALSSIHWVSEDEIYVTGPGTRYVLEGSIHGWSRRGPFDVPLHCVARFAGKLWVGCGLAGLHVLPDGRDELEMVKPNVRVTFFDPRENLVMSGRELIVATTDGIVFKGMPISAYQELADRLPPTW